MAVNVVRSITPDQALEIVNRASGNSKGKLRFCRDYGEYYALFIQNGNESKEEVVKNCSIVNKHTGKIGKLHGSGLEGKPWTARFDYGDNKIWVTTR